ncbi:hypothetical protein ACOMHN_030652 [Nucella lapillus]
MIKCDQSCVTCLCVGPVLCHLFVVSVGPVLCHLLFVVSVGPVLCHLFVVSVGPILCHLFVVSVGPVLCHLCVVPVLCHLLLFVVSVGPVLCHLFVVSVGPVLCHLFVVSVGPVLCHLLFVVSVGPVLCHLLLFVVSVGPVLCHLLLFVVSVGPVLCHLFVVSVGPVLCHLLFVAAFLLPVLCGMISGLDDTCCHEVTSFLLPVLCGMITRGLESSQFSLEKTPQVVVVAPTRELATQIQWEAAKFSKGTDVQTAVVYGGTDRRHQRMRLLKGANLVVGTPGRLLDFIRDSTISLAKVQYLILDEADRMLDLGFEPDIRKLVETFGMPPKGQRQTLMFSATFKEEIQRLAGDFLQDYLFITVGIVGGACADVTQTFLQVDQFQKREHLCQILNEMGTQKVLVFVGQKRNADFLASFLSQSGYPTTSIHGDRLQREREEALRAFREGKSSILIATNVAARGLDIPEVAHVINYDMPADIDEYVHRIGRTGRCGNLGHATSFYNPDTDHAMVGHLVRILGEANQEVPDWLADYANTAGGGGRGTGRFASKDIRRPKFRAGGDDSGYGDAGGDVVCDEECWD